MNNMPRWITIAFTVLSVAALNARAEDATTPRDYKGNLVVPESSGDFTRAGKGELFFVAQGSDKDHSRTTFDSTQEAVIDPYIGGGFGVGGNLNSYMNVNATVTAGAAHLTMPDTVNSTTFSSVNGRYFRADANVEVYPFRWRITPVVGGGLGVMNLRGNNSADASTGEFSETNLTWNACAGVRWDVNDRFFVKGLYRITWMRLSDTDDYLHLNGVELHVGWSF